MKNRAILHVSGWVSAGALAAVASVLGDAGVQGGILDDIRALTDTVRVATWVQTSWERLGDREEHTSANCIWAGQDNIRLDVWAGRGEGSTAVLYNGRVYGFRQGLLSFIRRSFDVDDPRIQSLRGNSMRKTGFMDDFRGIENAHELEIHEERSRGRAIIRYVDSDGLRTTLNVLLDPIRVLIDERSDRDGMVERYTYSDVRYNVAVDSSLLRP